MVRHDGIIIDKDTVFFGDVFQLLYGNQPQGRGAGFRTTARVVPTNLTEDFVSVVGADCNKIRTRCAVIIVFQARMLSLRKTVSHNNHQEQYTAKSADVQTHLRILVFRSSGGSAPPPYIYFWR